MENGEYAWLLNVLGGRQCNCEEERKLYNTSDVMTRLTIPLYAVRHLTLAISTE